MSSSDPQPLTPDPQSEAEACFLKAIARAQQAKFFELRATVRLSRLWREQEKPREAYEKLSEVYGWFSEGYDVTDLREAKALLAELSR